MTSRLTLSRHNHFIRVYHIRFHTSAFSAYNLHLLANGRDVTFPDVYYNEGNDYDATSGVFTCRIPGVYRFSATILASADNFFDVCNIKLNGNQKGFIYVPPNAGHETTGVVNQVFKLRHGDRVHVGCYFHLHPNNSVNMFTGVLVKADG